MAKKNFLLRELPSVDELLRSPLLKEAAKGYSASFIADAARAVIDEARAGIISGGGEKTGGELAGLVIKKIEEMIDGGIKRVVNATGTILHTNLGRALLSERAVKKVIEAGSFYTNLEFDLEEGARGGRDNFAALLLKGLTGSEDASIVNNNAAAVLLALNTLAEGKEVLISRGELIEIGGSFRLPDIIKKSGCLLKEVGTTNRTHPEDYSDAITENTALILKAHRSNFDLSGFVREVSLKELAAIGDAHKIPVVEDLGSGALVDLSKWGLPREPVVGDRLKTGAACVTFSGDKLLGGPQAGLIAGKKEIIGRIRKNPLKRALRCDKLTLTALEETLKLYLTPANRLAEDLPLLKMMTRDIKDIEKEASRAADILRASLGEDFSVAVQAATSVIGGGSLPGHNLPTRAVAVTHKKLSPEEIFSQFLKKEPPVIGRIKNDKFLLDMRTVKRAEDLLIDSGPPANKTPHGIR
ncbi:MAG: L-seryl-tRNA(Sec) selenium transferase [Thermodesulfobacteriota bacterium]